MMKISIIAKLINSPVSSICINVFKKQLNTQFLISCKYLSTFKNANPYQSKSIKESFNKKYNRNVSTMKGIQENISALQIKKRPVRKKKTVLNEDIKDPGEYSVMAFSTAEEYNLELLVQGLKEQDLYVPKNIKNVRDVVCAVAKYQVADEPREIYFFREGSVVFWNVTELESSNVLTFLRKYEADQYSEQMVHEESEITNYKYSNDGRKALEAGDFILSAQDKNELERYTFSNAMALSVKLGIWEASLDRYVDSIEFVTEDLKCGKKIKMSREEVLRKHGELLALRHLINLSSDLLDTPDFYWERDQLEVLYSQTCNYYNISRRTKVMNDKLNHCVELIELLASHLSDNHHVRLEWMIIILIMIEVGFETLHYIERFIS